MGFRKHSDGPYAELNLLSNETAVGGHSPKRGSILKENPDREREINDRKMALCVKWGGLSGVEFSY